jgi:aminoglycoside phosphotransferase (APT) family kinase protein
MPAVALDEDDLRARAEAVLAAASPEGELGDIVPLQGGHSSLTFWATWTSSPSATGKVVFKVAPAGLEPTKNRDVLRQARLQEALQGTGVPCPAVIARHEGTPPEIPPFYVMSFEEGDCVEPSGGGDDAPVPEQEVRPREMHAARILGLLHSLDPRDLGMGDEPEVTPAQELERWSSSFEACDEDLKAGHEGVLDRLAEAVPTESRSTLIHGDFRLGNTLSQGNEVVSVIDWEIWARSDPRVDLAWFLLMCNPDPELGRPLAAGMPGNDELLDLYQQHRGVEVSDMPWFEALVRYKQAAISALLIRNARRRGAAELPIDGISSLLESAQKRFADR